MECKSFKLDLLQMIVIVTLCTNAGIISDALKSLERSGLTNLFVPFLNAPLVWPQLDCASASCIAIMVSTIASPHLILIIQLQEIGLKEWIIYKPRWGAFCNTSLERHLNNLGVNTVVVCGCNFPNCPGTTIYEASERDFKIVLAKDTTLLVYDIGLQELKAIEVSIMNADECMTWLGSLEVEPNASG
jgi:hypothetical protein